MHDEDDISKGVKQLGDDEEWEEFASKHDFQSRKERQTSKFLWAVGRYTDIEFELDFHEDGIEAVFNKSIDLSLMASDFVEGMTDWWNK